MAHGIEIATMRAWDTLPEGITSKTPGWYVYSRPAGNAADYATAKAIPQKYRKDSGTGIAEMTVAEKKTVDDAELAAAKTARKNQLDALLPPTQAQVDAAKADVDNQTTLAGVRNVTV